jgi:hypothetical protein
MEERDMIINDDQPIRVAEAKCSESKSKGMINDLRMEQLSHGYILRVGCQSFAIEKQEELIRLLTMYIQEPDKTKDMWYDGKLFS